MFDLQPYVCTLEDCSASNRLFLTRAEWSQHEFTVHRLNWACNWCQGPPATFSRAEELKQHFAKSHPGEVTKAQMPLILEACERPMSSFGPSSCPFCTDWEALLPHNTAKAFGRHLARHLQQLALESIPLSIEGLEVRDANGASEGDDLAIGDSGDEEAPSFYLSDATMAEELGFKTALESLRKEVEERAKAAERAEANALSRQKAIEEYEMRAKARGETVDMKAFIAATTEEENERRVDAEKVKQLAQTVEQIRADYEADITAAEDQNRRENRAWTEGEGKAREMFEEILKAEAELKAQLKAQQEASAETDASSEARLQFTDAVGRRFAFPRHICRRWVVSHPFPQLTDQDSRFHLRHLTDPTH